HHTEQRFKIIMAGQRVIALVESTLPPFKDGGRYRGRVVPPHFPRHTTKEMESLDQAVQDRLGAFGRQSQGKRTIGKSPGGHQDGYLSAAIGKIDIDVSKVGFQALARIVVQRNERLAPASLPRLQIATNALVAPRIAMLLTQTPKELGDGVALLGWRLFI